MPILYYKSVGFSIGKVQSADNIFIFVLLLREINANNNDPKYQQITILSSNKVYNDLSRQIQEAR